MSDQLVLGGAIAKAAKREDSRNDMCKCGHSRDMHADGRGACTYGHGTKHGGCRTCPKFQSKKRAPRVAAPNFATPANGVDWFRGPPEIVRRKRGGWFVVDERSLTVMLEFEKTTRLQSLNVINRGGNIAPMMLSRLIAGDANARKAQKLRIVAAIEQAKCELRGAPKRTTITRIVSGGGLDDDNLAGACKALRDGVAEVLMFDDKAFSIAGQIEDAPALFYKQATPGARGSYAALVELHW